MAITTDLEGVTVVFDLDGTLIHTAPDLQATLNHVLETFGFSKVSAVVSQGLIGHGAKAMLRAGLNHQNIALNEARIDEMFGVFLEYYAVNIAVYSKPYPGCLEALDRLEHAKATLAVCTNKKQHLADRLLDTLDLSNRFAAIIGADSVANCKPHRQHLLETIRQALGSSNQAVLVGDSETDEKAALHAGLPFIGVSFGYGPLSAHNMQMHTVLRNYRQLDTCLIRKCLS